MSRQVKLKECPLLIDAVEAALSAAYATGREDGLAAAETPEDEVKRLRTENAALRAALHRACDALCTVGCAAMANRFRDEVLKEKVDG